MLNDTGRNTKLLLIGVDGLSFPLVERWVSQGCLPTIVRLMEDGCHGLMDPFVPSNSAVIWTSVMTGMHPRKHGVDSFIYYTAGERIIKKTFLKKLIHCGGRPLFRLLKKMGYVREVPFSLGMVREKMLWELFAENNRSVGIINWWNSWPAFPLPGYIISDRIHYWRSVERKRGSTIPRTHLVFPDHLLEEVKRRLLDPMRIPPEVYQRFMHLSKEEVERMKHCHFERHQLMSEFKYLYALDESVRRFSLFCLKEFAQPDFLALYFRGVDIISHCALKYAPFNRDVSVAEEEVSRFGDTVRRYYCYIDAVLGEVIEAVPSDTTVVLVSDHGFAREPDGRFGHRKSRPPGLLVASGPLINKGLTLKNASLYDIAPTILHLAGLPLSREMEGRSLSECMKETFLEGNPVRRVMRYGPPRRQREPSFPDSEEELKERLRALGYIE